MTGRRRPGASATEGGPTTDRPVRVVRVPVPAGEAPLESPEAWAVHGTVLLDRVVDVEIYGHDDLSLDAATVLATMVREQDYERVTRYVAVADEAPEASGAAATPPPEAVVGRAIVRLPMKDNTHLGTAHLRVHPQWRGQGVGSALWEACLAEIRDAGRTVIIGDSDSGVEPPAGPDALEPPTGSGRFPRHDPGSVFALHRGFALEQVYRHSELELPVPPERLDALRSAARERATGYRVHVWRDEVPDEWLGDLAVLETRMSTDAPNGDLVIEEDRWDAARVREAHGALRERGRRFVLAAAEHVATGTLAGFSMVSFAQDRPAVVDQEDTLVLREHRGHRLGMLVKVAVLDDLANVNPQAARVHTWNAEENDHMLAINVDLGFRPASVGAEWQLRL